MRLPITAAEIAPRIATGAFILNSGLGKRKVDEATAQGLHGFATSTYPFLKGVDPKTFATALSTGEIVLGAALLTPFVPTIVAGGALTAFSAGLLGLYLRTPGMTKDGSIAPTQDGLTVAKDVWLLGIGAGLVTQGLVGGEPTTREKVARSTRKASKSADKKARKLAAKNRKALLKSGNKATAKALKKASKASAKAGAAAGSAATKVRTTVAA